MERDNDGATPLHFAAARGTYNVHNNTRLGSHYQNKCLASIHNYIGWASVKTPNAEIHMSCKLIVEPDKSAIVGQLFEHVSSHQQNTYACAHANADSCSSISLYV